MPELNNSKRTIYQSTYSPIEVQNPTLIRGWDKWSFFAALAEGGKDFKPVGPALLERAARAEEPSERRMLEQAASDLEILSTLLPRLQSPDALTAGRVLGTIAAESLS